MSPQMNKVWSFTFFKSMFGFHLSDMWFVKMLICKFVITESPRGAGAGKRDSADHTKQNKINK